MNKTLVGPWDLAVVLVSLAALAAVGWHFRRRSSSSDEFFLGGRAIPWWAVGLSFVSAEVSAATLIAVPATIYRENCQYLQFFIGSAAARLVLAAVFLPVFYKHGVTSIYQFLGIRFGGNTQTLATLLFFVTRLLGSAVRLMVACLAISTLLGVPLFPVILLFTLVTAFYTTVGGFRAVVWTGVLQGLMILAAGAAAITYLLSRLDAGWADLWLLSEAGGRLSLFHLAPAPGKNWLSDPNLLWLAVLNGFFGSLAAFGTDQDFMQRLLSVKTREASQRSMRWAIPVSFGVLLLYVVVGLGLFAFYAQNPGAALPENMEKIFPHFVGHEMPAGLKGLLLSAVVLASIDSPLASLSTSFVKDLYARFLPGRTEAQCVSVGKKAMWVFGALLCLLAWWFGGFEKILWVAFKIGGVTFGALLGVFLLGFWTKRGSDRSCTAGMVTSVLMMLALLLLTEFKVISLGWSWLVILGTVITFSVGLAGERRA